MKTFIFVPIALNQALFYVALAKDLRNLGHTVKFINFHEPSDKLIEDGQFENYSFFKFKRKNEAKYTVEEFQKILNELDIESPNVVLTHEKLNFRIRTFNELYKKFYSYLTTTKEIFKQLKLNDETIVVQELGGFCSCLAVYYVSLKNKVPHYFIEPSFFRGRFFLVENSLAAPKISSERPVPSPDVIHYLQNIKQTSQIVIPLKDKHHYDPVFLKFFNKHNLVRLWEKSRDKFILGQEEEFSHIGTHVHKHLFAIINKLILKKHYKKIPDSKFLYYPLHVPGDVALTIRSAHCLDQLSLIDLISRKLPFGYKLCIKEHPAMVGAIAARKIKDLLKGSDNIVLLDPHCNNFDVMKKSAGIVTVNSKSGAEAMVLGKPVLVMGDAFYRDSGSVIINNDWNFLEIDLKNLPHHKVIPVESFF